ncbi:MAG TPA: MerR family transcriptional regulator [Xanthobacteraceae bacterium]|nr:MerR family transcriptional regulator [Xanthobacteraceae bacterium]
MDKAPDAFRTISEVAEDLNLPQHVLRFWETRFSQIKPMKRGGGRRYYRPDDIDLLRGIRHLLYGEGYTIRGAQRILKDDGVRFVQSVWKTGAQQPVHSVGIETKALREEELEDELKKENGHLVNDDLDDEDHAEAEDVGEDDVEKDDEEPEEDATDEEEASAEEDEDEEDEETDEDEDGEEEEEVEDDDDEEEEDGDEEDDKEEKEDERAEAPRLTPSLGDRPKPLSIIHIEPQSRPVPEASELERVAAPSLNGLRQPVSEPDVELEERPSKPQRAAATLSRDDLRKLQATLYELGECRRLLDAALKGES